METVIITYKKNPNRKSRTIEISDVSWEDFKKAIESGFEVTRRGVKVAWEEE